MADELENTSRPWGKIARMWATCFTPPSRISEEERIQYRRLLNSVKTGHSQNALVLGVTPELREILFQLGFHTTCIDISLDMMLAMNDLLTVQDPRDVLVRANWLDNPLRDGQYSVVLGDAVLPNIPYTDRRRMMKEVHRLLAPGGFFVTRAFCAPESTRFRDCRQILESFAGRLDTERAALELVLELQLHKWNSSDHMGSFRRASELLDAYHEEYSASFSDPALQKVHDFVCSFWFERFLDKIFLYATRVEEEELYRKYFETREVFEAGDHRYGAITPLYLLQKR